jgi:predicted negative regulator of RcsB-dependent stress response
MSQEKVDKYKKEKANRQAIIKAEKRKHVISVAVVFIVIVALAVWFGFSVYQNSQAKKITYYETNYTAIDDFLNGLDA